MSYVALFLTRDIVLRVIRFPLWWYTDGLQALLAWMEQDLRFAWRSLALRAWIKSLFLPMYGMYDVWSRGISFVARVLVILARMMWWKITALLYLLAIMLWCAWIPFALSLFFV